MTLQFQALPIDGSRTELLLAQSINNVVGERRNGSTAQEEHPALTNDADRKIAPSSQSNRTAVSSTLSDIEERLQALLDTEDLVPADQEQEFLVEFEATLRASRAKRDGIAGRIASLENRQQFCSGEIKRLQALKSSTAMQQERLEKYVGYVIERLGLDATGAYRKLEGNTSVLSLQLCPASLRVTNSAPIPIEYKRVVLQMPLQLWWNILGRLDKELGEQVIEATAKQMEVEILAAGVKAALTSGEEIDGAELFRNKTVRRR